MSPSFLWGAATAGHQVEGNNVGADVWLLEQLLETPFAEPSGDACDSLNRRREDIALIDQLGLNAFRFSTEWSWIEPAEGQFSQAWLDHYARIAATCREHGVSPIVTLSHFTSPRWFAALGGWGNPAAPRLFARFAERVAEALGQFASHVITFNEPNLPLMGAWTATPVADRTRIGLDRAIAAAGRACGSDRFAVWVYSRGEHVDNLIAGHREARAAWRKVRPRTPIGLSLAVPETQGVGTDEGVAAYRREAEEPFLEVVGEDDFVGVQTYGRLRMDATSVLPPPAGAELTQSGDEYYPAALGAAVTHLHSQTGRPIFVTENGIAAYDDRQRARYIPAAIMSLQAARRSGVPVIGYLHWSLLDNFEWRRGYAQRFGLVAVNRISFRRTAKPSARVYADLVRRAA